MFIPPPVPIRYLILYLRYLIQYLIRVDRYLIHAASASDRRAACIACLASCILPLLLRHPLVSATYTHSGAHPGDPADDTLADRVVDLTAFIALIRREVPHHVLR